MAKMLFVGLCHFVVSVLLCAVDM